MAVARDKDPSLGDDHASSFKHPTTSSTAGFIDGATVASSRSSNDSSSSSPSSSRLDDVAIVSEPWTRIFPEAYGIRRAIEDSPFRWCVRESSLWAVATGTVMGMWVASSIFILVVLRTLTFFHAAIPPNNTPPT